MSILKKKGFDLRVICSDSPLLQSYAQKMGFKYSTTEITRAINPFKDLLAMFNICHYIHKNKIKIVVGHSPKGALLAMLASRLMGVPVRIYFRHGLVYETMTGLKRIMMINLDRLTALCANKVICVSPSVFKQSLVDKLNSRSKQIVIGKGSCNGIDALEKFNPNKINKEKVELLRKSLNISPSDFVIGYCGRVVRDKGIIELIEAFESFQKESNNKSSKLLLVGGYEDRDVIPEIIKEKINDNPNIILTGFIFQNIEIYYALMSVSVLPSYREGFGTSNLEAASMRLPVITTRATGCVDSILENVTGTFVENNALSLCKAIEYYYYNENERKLHGENGRKFVLSYFTNEVVWNKIEKLYA